MRRDAHGASSIAQGALADPARFRAPATESQRARPRPPDELVVNVNVVVVVVVDVNVDFDATVIVGSHDDLS